MSGSLKRVEKVLAYMTRERLGKTELLVFEHQDHPEAGLQVPAGTVEPGEDVQSALVREVFEESGLVIAGGRFLGRFEHLPGDRAEVHFRNVFHVAVGGDVPDEWEHVVRGDGEDLGLVFRFYWVGLEQGTSRLVAGQGFYLRMV